MAAFAAVSLWLMHATPVARGVTLEGLAALHAWLGQWGAASPLLFVALGAALMGVGFSRLAFAAVAGALFGAFAGTLWAQLATVGGAMATFGFSRWVGRNMMGRRLSGRMRALDQQLRDNGFTMVLLIRLCPVGNNFVVNLLAGLSAVRLGPFVWASLVGYFPQTFIFALMGSGFVDQFHLRTGLGVGLFVIMSLTLLVYYRVAPSARATAALLREAGPSAAAQPQEVPAPSAVRQDLPPRRD